ncbi:MAG TPA: hypothetical protein VIJ66_00335, partial [Solirubrobacteraceae bacterium]
MELNLSIALWPASITYRSPRDGSDGLVELSTAIAAGLPDTPVGNENGSAGLPECSGIPMSLLPSTYVEHIAPHVKLTGFPLA